ncbi:solute carrier family 2, facilitated glucose transporter member 11-like isoform X2 [Stegostoma tigrinum]|uniref:solute carrier family 2, facilitated glucose transporter member 11-like isoform X2 n=1 Tax=Stegostoma tigrinum TaxID=3053191 RepID=UPI00286FD7EB|nr:solute carrier family 2, facilitated glucose transporter member 11-like isoform X2 [Stegostoma tigrinum]
MLKELLHRRKFIFFIFTVGIGGSFQFGFNISAINPPSEHIKNFINETWIERHETPLQEYSLMLFWSFLVSVYPVGGLVGAQFAAALTLKYGRQILGNENTWHLLLAFSGLPALIQLVTLPWLPESPRYLLMEKGDTALCIDALRRLWGPGDFTEEVEDMLAERAQMQGTSKKNIVQLFRDKTIRCQLLTAMAVSTGMQLSGINIIYFYASDVYHQLGISKENIPFVGIGSSGIEMLTSVMCGFIIERAGRKVLLWKGYCFMAFWILLLIITLSLKERFSWIPYCSLVFIFAYILTFGMGPGSVSGVLPLELFTQPNRCIALVAANSLQWLSLFALGLVFPFIIEVLGPFSFILFVVSCFLASLFTFYVLPETKGKTLLQINEEFNNLRIARKGMWSIFRKRPAVPNQTETLSTRA